MDQSDDDWQSVLRNTRKVSQVWGRLRKLLQREGVEMAVSEKFYCSVVQAVLLFGAETWVIMVPMMQVLEGGHVSFLWQVTRRQETRWKDGSWRQVTI